MRKLVIAAIMLAVPLAVFALYAARAHMPSMMTAQMEAGARNNIPHPLAQNMRSGMRHEMQDHSRHGFSSTQAPAMPGQDAFGAIQEIVELLQADPETDWSKVDLEALRQHLIDMNDVTLKAVATESPVKGGIEATITGTGRTVGAIQRMVPAHANELNKMNGWSANAEALPDGVRLTVIAANPAQATRIRGLGFIGLMVSGAHHQPHHLAMAKGEFVHAHN